MLKFAAMKNVLSVVMLLLCLSSCQLDECMNLECLNTGRCIGGACDCAQGFEGINCNIREIDKFLGAFTQGRVDCGTGFVRAESHLIREIPFDFRSIEINNQTLARPIHAEVKGWNFIIPEQRNSYADSAIGLTSGLVLSGQGWLDLEAGKLIYQLDNHGCRYELYLN